ncbi:MAG: DUF2892 domain-containing protein [Nanoarchaeota archaeon]
MEENIGKTDRIIRFLLGVGLFYLAFITNNKLLVILFTIFATISILESFIGFCGIYKMLHIDTKKMIK